VNFLSIQSLMYGLLYLFSDILIRGKYCTICYQGVLSHMVVIDLD
jgi:hypothetical protein